MKAFTLIELLVTVSIIIILGAIGYATYNGAMETASAAKHVSAGKILANAYQTAAADNNGIYLPARDYNRKDVFDAFGKPITMREIRARYPFRLAPYFDYSIFNTLLVGNNKKEIFKIFGERMLNYGISVFPSFGINNTFVGGYKLSNGNYVHKDEVIVSLADAYSNIILFVSSGIKDLDGYEYIRPPYYWGGSEENDDPSSNGFVSTRFSNKAIVVFLDGSVKNMSLKDLKDMRLWSKKAAQENNPNYIP
jgi:prepilin-type N-terminal cleavage/methylation domain-containing protein/prepilin-type processing-associated H-X9-DG protein